MKTLNRVRCVIGEGPIYKDGLLYYTNGMTDNFCIYDFKNDSLLNQKTAVKIAAFAFGQSGNIIISSVDGIYEIEKDGSSTPFLPPESQILYANDMKAGPDGRIYVGTQSEARLGISEKINGKLFSIDQDKNIKILLADLKLSNGMEWSADLKFFYHTDSDTNIIKEYYFDIDSGNITPTARYAEVLGVDGFTVGYDGCLYCACYGYGHIAVLNTANMQVENYIDLPTEKPSSCCFCGEDMSTLAVTSSSYQSDISKDTAAGFTFLIPTDTSGRKPFLFASERKQR